VTHNSDALSVRHKIIWPDVAFVAGMLLYLGVGFCTRVIISKVAAVEGFAEAAVELEANPLARAAMTFKYGFIIVQWSSIAFMSAAYYITRRRWTKMKGVDKELQYNVLAVMSIAIFLIFVQNMMNDLPILVGIMMGGV
jgi:hypothetical protein